MIGYIYTITNILDGKKYVGQTTDPYKRFEKHKSLARNLHYHIKVIYIIQ